MLVGHGWGTAPIPKLALLDVVVTFSDKAVFVHAINYAYDADMEADLDISALAPSDGGAVLHVLEGTPEDQAAARKSRMTERSRPVEVAGGKMRMTFPRTVRDCRDSHVAFGPTSQYYRSRLVTWRVP